MHCRTFRSLVPLATAFGLLALASCSSSSGGGSSPPQQPNVIVVPQGSAVVCTDGSAPPCR